MSNSFNIDSLARMEGPVGTFMNSTVHDVLSSHPIILGGASAAVIFYLVTNIIQMIAVFRLCRKNHFKALSTIILTIIVFIPFGIEASLLIIAYSKGREHRKQDHIQDPQHKSDNNESMRQRMRDLKQDLKK